jgi:uncharacterized protein
MRVVVAGGTGFLGSALVARLRQSGHSIAILSRNAPARDAGGVEHVPWNPNGATGPWSKALDGADALINLAGAGVADARWTPARKTLLRESRLRSTQSLVAALQDDGRVPAVFVSASGVGYYGDRGGETVTEGTAPGDDFLARLCVDWEQAAERAASVTRVVLLRTGLVMHPNGGALQKMLPPFRVGLGGQLGSGHQYLPWVHLEDWVHFVEWALATPTADGAFNVTSPQPVTNAELTRALGRALRRPTVARVPAFALRVALGELADTLLTGQRAIPARAQAMGFRFRFPEIARALADLLSGRRV